MISRGICSNRSICGYKRFSIIFYINFSIRSPNGTIIYNNVNGSAVNTLSTNNFTNWTARYLLINNEGKDIGQWLWNWTAMDSELTTFASANGSFVTSDTLFPNLSITDPTGTQTTQTPAFNFIVNESVELSTCYYNVTRASGVAEITTRNISCSANLTLPQLTTSLDYTIYLRVNDTSNQYNQTNVSFSVSISSGAGGGTGGTP